MSNFRLRSLFGAILLLGGTGYGANLHGEWLSSLFGSKQIHGARMAPVAKKIAEFSEGETVCNVEFSPDGSRLAVGSFTSIAVHVWAWQGHSHVERTFSKPRGTAGFLDTEGLRFSPDGRLLAISHGLSADEDGRAVIRVFDAQSGSIVHDFAEPLGGGDSRLSFSPDGMYFIRTYDAPDTPPRYQFIVHSVANWQPMWGLSTTPLTTMALAISPDGNLAAISGVTLGPGVVHKAQIQIIDLALRKVVRIIDNAFPQFNEVRELAWHPDGVHLAASGLVGGTDSGPDAVRIFDVRTGQMVAGEPVKDSEIYSLKYASTGKYLIEAGVEKSTRIWDGQHQTLLQVIPINAVAMTISRDGRYAAISDGQEVTIWELK